MKFIFTLFLCLPVAIVLAQDTLDLETIVVDSFLNGSDGNGGFSEAGIVLPNTYKPDPRFPSWSGWSLSSMADTTTPGFTNQYSAITGAGANGSTNYGVAFGQANSLLLTGEASGSTVTGMYVTNGTYPYLSMRDGDGFAKQFGGVTRNDPDYFLLTIKGYQGGELTTDSVDFYLADYRFEDNTEDYLVDTWTFVDLASLGPVDSLQFSLSSTDVGMFGMNTPAYFMMDQLIIDQPTSINDGYLLDEIAVYPNPTTDFIRLRVPDVARLDAAVYSADGRLLFARRYSGDRLELDLRQLPVGTYRIRVSDGDRIGVRTVVKM